MALSILSRYLMLPAGSLDGSEQGTRGSGSSDEEHHRTVRGREAQQMMQRLRDSRAGRSMSAPNPATMFTQGTRTSPTSGLLDS